MSRCGWQALSITLLLPLALLVARTGLAQDVTVGPTPAPGATPVDRCGAVLTYHDASLGRLATARDLVGRTTGSERSTSWSEGGSAMLDLLRAQRDEVVPPGGELAHQLVLATLAAWHLFMIDMDLGHLQPAGTGLADANEAMTMALLREEQATLELAILASSCREAPLESTPVPGQGSLPARDVTPEGGARIESCPPDVQSVYCVTPAAPAG